ncbi:hypothetical protein [Desulfocurvibacter africanus]|uniref:hypothetical protein n=1 Tax=Desulfocurvibacter africanus TaxID=873 RepID=UPI0004220972|nr:hypothetical protein [Desulfocurvibacter africanus]
MEASDQIKYIKAGIDLLKQFIPSVDWGVREKVVHDYMRDAIRIKPDGLMRKISYDEDKLVWYIMLAEAYMNKSFNYEIFQGSRVIPYFIALGKNIDSIKQIKNYQNIVNRLVRVKNDHPDAGIFELLVALLYIRNGYKVEFIPETQVEKTPDIYAYKDDELYIECKRFTKISEFSIKEREKWLSMWGPLGMHIQKNRIPIYIKIKFHKTLQEYSNDYLALELIPKLKLIPTTFRSIPIDNNDMTVEVRPVDQRRIKDLCRSELIHSNSAYLIKAVLGEHAPFSNYRLILDAKRDEEIPTMIDDLRFAAGALWECDSLEAKIQKARHIKRQLAKAVEQLPDNKAGVIHIGIEAVEGDEIEQIRLLKSFEALMDFDMKGKMISWLRYHILAPGTSPEETWFFEETAVNFCASNTRIPDLKTHSLIPFDEIKDGFAWDYR